VYNYHDVECILTDRFQPSNPRTRAGSITRQITGFGERLRQRATHDRERQDTTSGDEAEENKRKSKLLLGGQKLFRTLRDS